ncbi:MAG: cation transporter [Gemmatimonadetes bacterium]|nr:cation transporter [Gemmatimonadota bacterium]
MTSRKLATVLALTAGFLLVEIIGGVISNSLALLADAGHMATDVAALALAWFGARGPAATGIGARVRQPPLGGPRGAGEWPRPLRDRDRHHA